MNKQSRSIGYHLTNCEVCDLYQRKIRAIRTDPKFLQQCLLLSNMNEGDDRTLHRLWPQCIHDNSDGGGDYHVGISGMLSLFALHQFMFDPKPSMTSFKQYVQYVMCQDLHRSNVDFAELRLRLIFKRHGCHLSLTISNPVGDAYDDGVYDGFYSFNVTLQVVNGLLNVCNRIPKSVNCQYVNTAFHHLIPQLQASADESVNRIKKLQMVEVWKALDGLDLLPVRVLIDLIGEYVNPIPDKQV